MKKKKKDLHGLKLVDDEEPGIEVQDMPFLVMIFDLGLKHFIFVFECISMHFLLIVMLYLMLLYLVFDFFALSVLLFSPFS